MTRFPGLDLLRAIAIIWVLLFHAMTEGLGTPFAPIGRIGWMAVDLFFVLSGYLIGLQLFKSFAQRDTAPLRHFYLRRLLRILPAYWVVLALYTWAPGLREARGLQPSWQFFTFTENFLIDAQNNRAFSHAWSLCVEEHFYLLFPLLAWWVTQRGSWKLTAMVCSGIFIAGCILRAATWRYGLDNGALLETQPSRFVELIYYPTTMRTDGLLAGVILAAFNFYRPRLWAAALARPYVLLTMATVASTIAIPIAAPRTTFSAVVWGFPLLATAMAFATAAFASPHWVLGRAGFPGARLLATITFSLYLSHKMAWHVIHTYAPSLVPPHTRQEFVVYTMAALAGGTLLYLGVERPFLRLRTRFENVRPRLRSAPAVAITRSA